MEKNENEEPMLLKDEKLDVIGILKECVQIPRKDLNFIFLVILTSTPFLCFLLFFEPLLYRSLLEFSNSFLFPHKYTSWGYYGDFGMVSYSTEAGIISHGHSQKLIQLCLLYLFPYNLLELLSVIVTVDAASVVYTAEKPVGLREMMSKSLKKRWDLVRAPLVTSTFLVFLSTCVVVGLVGIVGNCFVLLNGFVQNYYYVYRSWDLVLDLLIASVHGGVFVGSVLEGVAGLEAFELADYYGRGSSRRGFLLMLVFFVWGVGLRLPCLLGWWTWGFAPGAKGLLLGVVYVGLILVGNVLKWVACAVLFLDCKKQVLEKKTDSKV